MIDSPELVFLETAPDLEDPELLARLKQASRTGVWLRVSALLLGVPAVLGSALVWALLFLPERALGLVGLHPLGGSVTPAGHVFLAIVCLLGLLALRFAWRLFADEAPYRLPAERLRRLEIRKGEVTGFGHWLSAGGAHNRYQRIHWRANEATGCSPYVVLTLSIWLRVGDPVWIGLDPTRSTAPLFLGTGRAMPSVLKDKRPSLASLYTALEAHLAEGGDARVERVLKLWISGRK